MIITVVSSWVYDDYFASQCSGLDVNTFRAGPNDRGASIRIPNNVAEMKCGYIEDRRPRANCDPNVVSTLLMKAALEAEAMRTRSQQ